MSLVFTPWKRFKAEKDDAAIKRFLRDVADNSEKAFKTGIRGGQSGRLYARRGGVHQASAPGEYPARDSGALEASIDTRVTATEATIGTGVFYAKFLRNGTRKMARRKMSDDALQQGAQSARFNFKRWIRWARV